MRRLFNFFLVLLAINNVLPLGFLVEYVIRLEKYGQCPHKKNLPLMVNESHVLQIGQGKTAAYATINVKREFYQDQVENRFYKCNDRTDTSCEQVIRFVTSDACKMLNKTSEMWSDFVDSFHPRMNCPTKKGTYRLINGTFDFSKSRNIFFNNGYWKLYFDGYENTTNVFCFVMEFDVVPYRKRSRF